MEISQVYTPRLAEQLTHEKFLQTLHRIMLFGLIAAFGVILFSGGGMEARWMPFALCGIMLALGAQFLMLWRRLLEGVLIFKTVLWFLPWMLFAVADVLFISPVSWRAEYRLALSVFPIVTFFIAQHQGRQASAQRKLIGAFPAAVLVFILAGFIIAGTSSNMSILGTAGVRNALCGFVGDSSSVSILMVLSFFLSAMLLFNHHVIHRVRMSSFCLMIAFLGVLIFLGNGMHWIAFGVGLVSAALIIKKSFISRLIWCGTIALVCTLFAGNSSFNIGLLRNLPIHSAMTISLAERDAQPTYPLAATAASMIFDDPILGKGGESFPLAFEKKRPAQWNLTPRSSGSFYMTLLGENGIVGASLLLGVLGWFIFQLVRMNKVIPWRVGGDDKMRANDLPEDRVLLAGTVGAFVFTALLFIVDCPGISPVIMAPLALLGGVAMRIVNYENMEPTAMAGRKLRHIFALLAVLVPAVVLAVVMPILIAQSKYERGVEIATESLSSTQTGTSDHDVDLYSLEGAEKYFIDALAANPRHSDTWWRLADIYSIACFRNPDRASDYSKIVEFAARNALKGSTDVAQYHVALASALAMRGDFDKAKVELETTIEQAPNNVPVLLRVADCYRSFPDETMRTAQLFQRLREIVPLSRYVVEIEGLMYLSHPEVFPEYNNQRFKEHKDLKTETDDSQFEL